MHTTLYDNIAHVLGNRDLGKERSLNFDLAASAAVGPWQVRMEGFFYHFFRYLYQSPRMTKTGTPLLDPYHGTPVWELTSVPARVFGLAFAKEHTQILKAGEWSVGVRLEALRGMANGGGNLPRMMPNKASGYLRYARTTWGGRLAYERVDRSRHESTNEPPTDGYG